MTSPRRANVLFALGTLILAMGWMVTLRPQSLGGPAGYVIIRGVSMNPIYHSGDLVMVRKQAAYHTGEIVAYRVPEQDVGAGIVVIHRIVGGDADEGFILEGDNNGDPDDWRPKLEDMVGRAWLLIPRGGALLAFLHSPLALASLAAGVAVALLLVEPPRGRASNRAGHSPSASG